MRLLGLLFSQRFDDGFVELLQTFVGADFVEADVVVSDFAVVTDHNPEGQGGAEAARVAEARQQGTVVDRHVVAEVHEFLKLLEGPICCAHFVRLGETGIDVDADHFRSQLLALVVEKIEVADLAIRFGERVASIFPEVQDDDVSFEFGLGNRFAVCLLELQLRSGLPHELLFQAGDSFEPSLLLDQVLRNDRRQFRPRSPFGLFLDFADRGLSGLPR